VRPRPALRHYGALRGIVRRYCGYDERTPGPLCRREVPAPR